MMKRALSYLMILALGWPTALPARSIRVHLDGQYTTYETEEVFRPYADSRVTIVLGNREFRPDGYIYENNLRSDRTWGISSGHPRLLRDYQSLDEYSYLHQQDVVIYLQPYSDHQNEGESAGPKSESDQGPIKHRIHMETQGPSGLVITAGWNEPFLMNGKVYAQDGKVYEDGVWTGGRWGLPAEGFSFEEERGFWGGVGDLLNSPEIANGINFFVEFQRIRATDRAWREFGTRQRAQSEKILSQFKNRDRNLARALEQTARHIRQHNLSYVSDILGAARHYQSQNPGSQGQVGRSQGLPLEEIPPQSHIIYAFGERTRESLTQAFEGALNEKDYGRLTALSDIFLNSEDGLPEAFQPYFRGSIFQPHLVDPQIRPSPLSTFDQNWDQSTYLGQVATRTANSLQRHWALHRNYEFSPAHEIARYLASLSFFMESAALIDIDPLLAEPLFQFTQVLIDTPAGMAVGTYQAIEGIVRAVPVLAGALVDFTVESFRDPNHAIRTYHSLMASLPGVRSAVLAYIHKSLDGLFGASHYQRGKVVGDLFFDTITSITTAGAASAAGKGAKTASAFTKSLRELGRPVKKSPEWLRANAQLVEDFSQFASKVENIQFYSPASPGPLHMRPLKKNKKISDLLYDERGLLRNDLLSGNQTFAHTFRSEHYMSYTLKEKMYFIQVTSKTTPERVSAFWTSSIPTGPGQAQLDLALLPQWGNRADHWRIIEVPRGTRIFEGQAAAQRYSADWGPGGSELADRLGRLNGSKNVIWPGGAPQIVIDIPEIPTKWIKYYGDF